MTGARGVDVASFQGTPGAWAAKAGQIAWAAVKFTELEAGRSGPVRYLNPDAAADWAYLKSKGLGRIAYMFGHPEMPAAASVLWFTTATAGLIGPGDGVCLDLEVTGGKTPDQVAAWAREVMAQLRAHFGRAPLLYTFRSFATSGNCTGLAGYPLWIADPSHPAGQPQVPGPWRSWLIHQYEITGGIDRDVTAGTWAATAAVLGAPQQEGPTLKDLGGTLNTANGLALGTARWGDGTTVIAGVGSKGQITARRWTPAGHWGAWADIHPGPAVSGPVFSCWGTAEGRLYYTASGGHVHELTTTDAGKTWR